MPLKKGNSKKIRSYNIAELIKAGYSPRQATAIAYENAPAKKRTGKALRAPPHKRKRR